MFRFLLDRTAVLFLGVAAGTAIGFAFGTGGARKEAIEIAPVAAPPTQASASIAPPPPAGPAAAHRGGPVLLTYRNSLPASVRDEILRLRGALGS